MSENDRDWGRIHAQMVAAGEAMQEAAQRFAAAVDAFGAAWQESVRPERTYPKRRVVCQTCHTQVRVHPSGIMFVHGDGPVALCDGSRVKVLPNLEIRAEDLGKDDPDLYEDGPGDDSAAIVTGGPMSTELWLLPKGSWVVDVNGDIWDKVSTSQAARYPWHMRDGQGVAPRLSSDLARTFGPIQSIHRP